MGFCLYHDAIYEKKRYGSNRCPEILRPYVAYKLYKIKNEEVPTFKIRGTHDIDECHMGRRQKSIEESIITQSLLNCIQ